MPPPPGPSDGTSPRHRPSRSSAACWLTAVALICVALLALGSAGGSAGAGGAPHRRRLLLSTPPPLARPCVPAARLIDEVLAAPAPPQLSGAQLGWIAEAVSSAARASGGPANLLVFGLGEHSAASLGQSAAAQAVRQPSQLQLVLQPLPHINPAAASRNAGRDSGLWRRVNCRGRVVFLESDDAWIRAVTDAEPGLEFYKVSYNTTLGGADEYYSGGGGGGGGGRWSLDVPASVAADCFDVILVDAPPGYRPSQPGAGAAALVVPWAS